MIRRVSLLLLLLTLHSIASNSFKDSDMDGVIDKRDRCKHTPFFDLVDRRGCTIKTLVVKK